MTRAQTPHPRPPRSAAAPLTPQRKWQTITVGTLIVLPAFWALLAGAVGAASAPAAGGPNPAAALALGMALIPFAFMVLAFMSRHPKAPTAVVWAMVVAIVVGIPVSAIAADAVTGVVAGLGAGGVVALRAEPNDSRGARALGVVVAAVYAFVLVRTVSAFALLFAPVFPFTAIGLADHLVEWRRARRATPEAA